MPKNRFFTPDLLQLGPSLLSPEENRHVKVMRLVEGAELELVNGLGQLATARLIKPDTPQSTIEIVDVKTDRSLRANPCLIQALARETHLDILVEKAVELGVGEIWLFPGARSEKQALSESRLKRLIAITIAAMKQSGQLFLPKITLYPTLLKWKTLPPHTFYGSLEPKAPLLRTIVHQIDDKAIPYFVVGPESGLSPEEMRHLNKLGAKGLSLHSNTLRTETAGPFAMGLFMHLRAK